MILEANKLQYERTTVYGYDALKTYVGYSVRCITIVHGYKKPTLVIEQLSSNEWIITTNDMELLGVGAYAYDALLNALERCNEYLYNPLYDYDVISKCLITITDLIQQIQS